MGFQIAGAAVIVVLATAHRERQRVLRPGNVRKGCDDCRADRRAAPAAEDDGAVRAQRGAQLDSARWLSGS